MTTRTSTAHPLRSRSFGALLAVTVGGFGGYALLLSVVPLWAVTQGAGKFAAGATNGVFMLVTVLTQLFVPWLLRRVGHRVALAAGTALIGLPAPLFALAGELWSLLLVSGMRGIGFGLLTVAGSALVAEIVPTEVRGRAAGLYGLAVGLPNVVFLSAGVWLSHQIGFAWVFLVAGAFPVVTALAVLGVRPVRAAEPRGRSRGLPLALAPPWLVMTIVATTAGGLLAFVPMAVGESVAPVSLAAFGATMMLGRWAAGHIGDRFGTRRAQLPSIAVAAVGLVLFAAGSAGAAGWAVLGAGVFGAGFGAVQNITLVAMFERAPSGAASAVWNIAYDAGNGLGSVGFGALLSAVSYPVAFGLAAAAVVVCAPVALLGRASRGWWRSTG
ncbi:MFS transporter [Salinifilum aidingensis]